MVARPAQVYAQVSEFSFIHFLIKSGPWELESWSRRRRRTTTRRRRRRRAAADRVELPGLELERGELVVVVGERGVEVRIVRACADAPPSTVT